jgi:hypothetical protein
MEDIKLLVNNQSVGSITIDTDGNIVSIFVHKTIESSIKNMVDDQNLIGKQINERDYYNLIMN